MSSEEPCPKCGAVHEAVKADGGVRCQKHNRRGVQCGGFALVGLDACVLHSGRSKAEAKRVGQENIAQREAEEMLARLTAEGTPVTDPLGELQRVAGGIIAMRDGARALVRALETAAADTPEQNDEDDVPVGVTASSGLAVYTPSGLDLHPFVKLAERMEDRARAVLVDMSKLGYEERQVRIAEHDSMVLEAALIAALGDVGIDPALVLPVLGEKLRAIEAGDVIDVEELG